MAEWLLSFAWGYMIGAGVAGACILTGYMVRAVVLLIRYRHD